MSEAIAPVVLVEEREEAILVTINRPTALNALNAQVMDELASVLSDLGGRANGRPIILTGAGRAFVAGADIAGMVNFTAEDAEAFAAKGQKIAHIVRALPVPVIAAVNGFALGGGCELAMTCDIVLAGPSSKFGQPEVNLGVIPGFGGTQRLVRRAGIAVAMDLCLTGRIIGPAEAVAVGIASRAVEGDVVEAALEVAREIRKKGPFAVRMVRRAIHENADADLDTGLAAERSLFALCFATADQDEGMAAFLGKRPAVWSGR
jgi:enoyl-CoA hydratase